MNAKRRNSINKLIERLTDIQGELICLQEDIQSIMDEEQDAYDNLPESIQDGLKGEVMEEAIDSLQSAIDEIDAMSFDDIQEYLEGAL